MRHNPRRKKMKTINIVPYGALPCEAKTFEVNGVEGYKEDFGDNGDVGSFDYEYGEFAEENWACADNQFSPHADIPEGVLAKYSITEAEYRDIQDKCTELFAVGGCGWCV
jgi:hypothetical protein